MEVTKLAYADDLIKTVKDRMWMQSQAVKSEWAGALSFTATFFIMAVTWYLCSGRTDPLHVGLGVFSCGLVALISHDLLFMNILAPHRLTIAKRFALYIPWLIYQIVLANVHVAKLALSPKMPLDPEIIRFKSKLESDVSLVTFANSITLTPGTITVDIREGEYYVHAIDKAVAEDLLSGEMEDRVAHVFVEADHAFVGELAHILQEA